MAYLVLLLFGAGSVVGQTIPYGTNNSYTYGLMPANTGADANATSWFNYWQTNFTKDCGSSKTLAINDYSSNNAFSEGQGYGMLLAAYKGDKTLFDALWKGYKDNRNGNGVMNWTVNCAGNVAANGATDGDLDAAMALLVANYQWPATTTPYNYATDATALINAIKSTEFVTGCTAGRTVQKPGDAFASGCLCTNPSYFATGYYRAFAKHVTADAAFWNKAADDGLALLLIATDASTGLNPAWTNDAGSLTVGTTNCGGIAAGGGGAATDYQFDAARTPWRIVVDYLWWGTPAAKTYLDKITMWANSKGVSNIVAGYTTAGSANVTYKNSAFTGAFTIGMMANTTNANLDAFYNWWVSNSDVSGSPGTKLDDKPYFQNALRTTYSFVASGNFWNPYATTCVTPKIGADLSTCTGTVFPLTLTDAATPTTIPTGVTYTWKRILPSVLSPIGTIGATARIRTIAATDCPSFPCKIAVIRDSTGGCTQSDTITISNTIPTPDLGSDPSALCAPSFVNLATANSASFPSGTTWKWYFDAPGAPVTFVEELTYTTSTYANVRKPGTFRVEATKGACAATTDDILITTNSATPNDICNGSSFTPTVSISGYSGATTDYDWFSSSANCATGTPILTNGDNRISYTAPSAIASSTSYWVKNTAAVNANVGPYFPTTPTTYTGGGNTSADAGVHTRFQALSAFTITELYIPYMLYNAGEAAKLGTFEIIDDATTSIITTTPQLTGALASGSYSASGVYIVKFSTSIPITVGTYRIRFKATSGSDGNPYLFNDNINPVTGAAGVPAFPYLDNAGGSTMKVIGSNVYSTAKTTQYGFFVGFKISAGTSCNCLEVVAKVGTCSSAAPVSLLYFYAEKEATRSLLTWATALELNNDYFAVERSKDGINFEKIGTVNGNGTTAQASTYSFVDERYFEGTVYYRLAQYDLDGTLTYSNSISVVNELNVTISIAPNPFNTSTTLFIAARNDEKAKAKITDLAGHALYEGVLPTNELVTLGETLPSGVYFLQLQVNETIKILKIIKQ